VEGLTIGHCEVGKVGVGKRLGLQQAERPFGRWRPIKPIPLQVRLAIGIPMENDTAIPGPTYQPSGGGRAVAVGYSQIVQPERVEQIVRSALGEKEGLELGQGKLTVRLEGAKWDDDGLPGVAVAIQAFGQECTKGDGGSAVVARAFHAGPGENGGTDGVRSIHLKDDV